MKRPWWQEPRAWHDSWARAALGYGILLVLLLLASLAVALLMNRVV